MKNTVGVRPTKEQKRQKSGAKQDGQLIPSDSVALREAGKKLQKLNPHVSISNSNAYNVLLKKLRTGELSAGFYVTSDRESWVEISNDYWRHVETNRFKDILQNESHPGIYKIKPREFAEQIAGIFVERANAVPEATTRALTSFMTAAASGYEPEIPFRVWQKFLEKSGASDPAAKTTKRGSGNTESPKWVGFAAHVLGYCIAEKTSTSTKRTNIQATVLELAKKKGVDTSGWPGESSARDFLKEAWAFAKHLEGQHET
ncbi:hypothetical protein [Bradyrhizobium sp. URHD0069]|uniref:hypothetical protein n=1 Tax=Bradyrhizobium sp. URHD0069 TaxID=1380355 RepID=UPI000495EA71|nr:hypothetical protein [Bradyrhizobium sp. URHD0069]